MAPWQDWPSSPRCLAHRLSQGCSQLSALPLNLHAPHQLLAGSVVKVAWLA